MKTLIVEDDFTSRLLLQEWMKVYGPTHIAVNGREAVEAVRMALDEKEPYQLICMDIMMPEMDGREALEKIRALESLYSVPPHREARIIMTSALGDPKTVVDAFYKGAATAYLVKPLDKAKLLGHLREFKLI